MDLFDHRCNSEYWRRSVSALLFVPPSSLTARQRLLQLDDAYGNIMLWVTSSL